MKTQRGVEVYLHSFFNLALDGEGVQGYAPATVEIETRYPFREGRFGRVRKISLPLGFDPWTFKPVASRL